MFFFEVHLNGAIFRLWQLQLQQHSRINYVESRFSFVDSLTQILTSTDRWITRKKQLMLELAIANTMKLQMRFYNFQISKSHIAIMANWQIFFRCKLHGCFLKQIQSKYGWKIADGSNEFLKLLQFEIIEFDFGSTEHTHPRTTKSDPRLVSEKNILNESRTPNISLLWGL